MALTPEQQSQLEYESAVEASRAVTSEAADSRRAKLEMVRAAKEILVENRRTQPAAESTDISASSVIILAEELIEFVNS